ncbi:hypothetical protein B0T11DRAFT_340419 [Plectosphaerella cucumerina]|uniref:YCII-related domain-containing protein n=1 Tax=Plectosphaerella cucumerina TaxID=40658 RepID=A0A8K0X241_9PEZI|nr:hypothetical protein B0T11DRAFT_340419 [Plectosphaerella cucumerina]
MASRLFTLPRTHLPSIASTVRHPAAVFRTMSSAASPRTYEWLVVVPDKPGTLAKRLEVRPTHFANLKDKLDNGIYKMGGAVLDEVPETDDPNTFKFSGSTLVCIAESREEILGWLNADIYAETGVWDVEKAQIWPFKCAFRHQFP